MIVAVVAIGALMIDAAMAGLRAALSTHEPLCLAAAVAVFQFGFVMAGVAPFAGVVVVGFAADVAAGTPAGAYLSASVLCAALLRFLRTLVNTTSLWAFAAGSGVTAMVIHGFGSWLASLGLAGEVSLGFALLLRTGVLTGLVAAACGVPLRKFEQRVARANEGLALPGA